MLSANACRIWQSQHPLVTMEKEVSSFLLLPQQHSTAVTPSLFLPAPAAKSASSECYPEALDRETSNAIARSSEAPSFEQLAASQGVCPVTEFETLLGRPSAEDESVDDFSAMLRAWRQEGSAPAPSR